jgi:hypothetical protein
VSVRTGVKKVWARFGGQASIVRSPSTAPRTVEPQGDAHARSVFLHRPRCPSLEKRPRHAPGATTPAIPRAATTPGLVSPRGHECHPRRLSGQSTMTPRQLQTLPRGPLPPMILVANGRPWRGPHDCMRLTSGEASGVGKITTRITKIHVDSGGDFRGKPLEVAGLWHRFVLWGTFAGGG